MTRKEAKELKLSLEAALDRLQGQDIVAETLIKEALRILWLSRPIANVRNPKRG